jgi:Tol biopolymer transport system component
MGEVWRARDTRLAREVAIKVLPVDVASDASRLKRFEKEARSASALNHPNIVTIYDIGSSDSIHWIAMEKVEGKTLREILFGGALPVRKLLPMAAQIADGLARAHEAGIVHRDLKPENVMVTKDGLVKILDFGLAKLTATGSGSDEGSQLATETGTSPGVVLGTVGYMSPEQAGAQPVDFRSDQFSFGSILYEMASGKRAFQKVTAVDTLSAILHEEPKPIGEINPEAPAPLRWIVERCLAKDPERRYAATKDLARDLEALRDRSPETTPIGAPNARRRTAALSWLLAAAALAAGGVLLGRWLSAQKAPAALKFQRLTFRRGFVEETARFTSDGQTIVYSARWDGQPNRVFVSRLDTRISQRVDIPDAALLSLSSQGELAIASGRPIILSWEVPGTFATVPISGGTPREIATDVRFADWAPDGKRLAVIRQGNVEFPPGQVIYQSTTWIRLLRFSPAGDRLAFIEGGSICVIDVAGKPLFLTRKFSMGSSFAWSPAGDEIWASDFLESPGAVYAFRLDGRERVVLRTPTTVRVVDIARDGRVLLFIGNQRWESWSRPNGETRDQDLTVLANSDAIGISPDGRNLLVNDSGAFYLRKADGSPAQKLGEGTASELSADGKWAIVVRNGPPARLVLVPTGVGEERILEDGGLEEISWEDVRRSADGRRLLFSGHEKGRPERMYVQDIASGKPRPLTPPDVGVDSTSISPDGRFVIVEQRDGYWLYPVDGGEKRKLAGFLEGEDFVWRNWSEDGRYAYAWNIQELPFRVSRVELATGRREPWRTIMPQDPAGIWSADLMLTPDGKSYAYNCKRQAGDLYVVEGLK